MDLKDMTLEQAIQWFAGFNVSEDTAKYLHAQGEIPSPEEFPPSIPDAEIENIYVNLVGMEPHQVSIMLSMLRYGGSGDVFVEEDDRMDADDEEDEVAEFIKISQQRAKAGVDRWIKKLGLWIGMFDSLEAVQSALKTDLVDVFDQLEGDRFEKVLYQSMMVGELAGRVQVLEEDERQDSFREDATPWYRMPFGEAISYFRSKVTIPTREYKSLQDGFHDWAFTISGVARADFLEDARWLIDQAISEGNDFETFKKQWTRLIGRKGWQPGEKRLFTIYDTNVKDAVGTGRGKQMLDPEVRSRRPIIIWRHRDSPNPRENHQQLHNKGIPSIHSFWQRVRFPGGWGCRCSGFAASEEYCKRNGIEILENPPNPDDVAEEGFRYPLTGLDEQQREQMKSEMVGRVDVRLREKILG